MASEQVPVRAKRVPVRTELFPVRTQQVPMRYVACGRPSKDPGLNNHLGRAYPIERNGDMAKNKSGSSEPRPEGSGLGCPLLKPVGRATLARRAVARGIRERYCDRRRLRRRFRALVRVRMDKLSSAHKGAKTIRTSYPA